MESERELLDRVLGMVASHLEENADPRTPVIEYLEPSALRKRLDLSLDGEGVSLQELPALIESYLRYSVRTAHPQFVNQLYGGFCAAGFVGDVVTSLMNTSMYTYEVAPVATLMELELIRKMNALIGYRAGEGIFCTGGSNANLLGLLCARDRAFPEIKNRGYRDGERPVLFVSDQAHYSFTNAANVLGLGVENLVSVRTDERGRMIPDELDAEVRRAAERGGRPFFVGATAGTTVLGAFDPLPEIAAISAEHGTWLHVDGAWGGPVLISDRHRHLLDGAASADSFTWDAHKLMGASLTCTAFLTRHEGALRRACGIDREGTKYLFHDGHDAALDLGPISLQCGRRVDSLRLWLMWKQLGDRGLAAQIDRLFELARSATEQVVAHPRMELMAVPQFLNICFRYRPSGGADPNAFNLELRERLRKGGRSFLNYSHLRGDLVLRLVLSNAELTEDDLTRFFDNVTAEADRLETG